MTAQRVAESPARVEFPVQFSRGPKGRRLSERADPAGPTGSVASPSKAGSASSVPKITRLLVLGHHFERLVREGKVRDYAEIARLTGLTRARVTQIVNLTLLAPEIQEAILNMSSTLRGRDAVTEHDLRPHVTQVEWERQRHVWAQDKLSIIASDRRSDHILSPPLA